jgi:hypothetical protein
MRRIMFLLGMALLGYALLPALAQAQVIYVQPRPYIVAQPVVPSYYVAPSVTTYSAPASYSYYPPSTTAYSYSAPAPTYYSYSAPAPTYYSYSAPAPTYYSYSAPTYYSYSAPAAVVSPGGVYTTRSYYGYGIFRPRGYNTESYYTPLP